MLETDDRRLLRELVHPPDGYSFSEAIVTTYSLDLLSLLIVPLHFTTFEYEGEQGEARPDPLALLSALQDNVDRLSIFCQAGQIAVPTHQQRLFGYLEPAVIEVRAPREGGVFHPKLWALRYTSDDSVRYRLGVFSRNLTADRCWDIALVVEGEVQQRTRGYSLTKPLAEFVAALPGMAIRSLVPKVTARATLFAEELRRIEFEPPEPFENLVFWPMGHTARRARPFSLQGKRSIVVSPFLSERTLSEFAEEVERATLVSRPDALDAVSPQVLEKFDAIKVLADAVTTELADDGEAPAYGSLSGLHSKLYVVEHGWNVHVFTGSANATHAAIHDNVEFMVELVGRRTKAGIDDLLQGESGKSPFGALLQDYTPPAAGPVPESAEQRLERALNRFGAELASTLTGLKAEATEGDNWSLSVIGASTPPDAESLAISACCRPISLGEGSSQPLDLSGPELVARFPQVSAESLTSFLVVSLSAEDAGITGRREFVLNLPLTGGPEDRRGGIVRAILKDRRAVMRFLLLLLSDIEAMLVGESDVTESVVGSSNGNNHAPHARILLEPMLRALHREPERLDRIDRFLAELCGPTDGDRLPEGWDEIWPPIWAERERLRT
jgi:hypothetical protein